MNADDTWDVRARKVIAGRPLKSIMPHVGLRDVSNGEVGRI
ncbi:hypothetical protein [Thermosulfidibacter takaii]|nr:hypothetical protein [Thermosulfidibacter takaii]